MPAATWREKFCGKVLSSACAGWELSPEGEENKRYCLQLTRPTLEQIREITLRAEQFLRDHESATVLRGYAHLRPSETDGLHRAQPSPLTMLAIEQEYVLQDHEWQTLKIEQARYMQARSTAPL